MMNNNLICQSYESIWFKLLIWFEINNWVIIESWDDSKICYSLQVSYKILLVQMIFWWCIHFYDSFNLSKLYLQIDLELCHLFLGNYLLLYYFCYSKIFNDVIYIFRHLNSKCWYSFLIVLGDIHVCSYIQSIIFTFIFLIIISDLCNL